MAVALWLDSGDGVGVLVVDELAGDGVRLAPHSGLADRGSGLTC